MSIASRIIDRFGGTREASRKINLPPSTIQSWKASGRIPSKHHDDVLAAARANGVDLKPDDFFESPAESPPNEGRAAC